MSSMFFGHYLLEHGVINRDALLDALNRQRKSNRTLQEIAVREGLLDQSKADQINAMFRISSSSQKDLCLSQGRLTQSQVDRLAEIQAAEWLRIGAALVLGGHLSEAELDTHLTRFSGLDAAGQKTLDGDFDHLDESTIVRTCTELTLRHVARVTGAPVKLQQIEPSDGTLKLGYRRFSQNIVGDRNFCIAVDFPDLLFSLAAEGLLGIKVDTSSDVASDAGCELINLIGGNACTKLEPEGYTLRPEPPFSPESPEPKTSVRAIAMAGENVFEFNIFIGTA